MEKTISEDIATTKLRIKLCMTVYKMRDLEKETHLKGGTHTCGLESCGGEWHVRGGCTGRRKRTRLVVLMVVEMVHQRSGFSGSSLSRHPFLPLNGTEGGGDSSNESKVVVVFLDPTRPVRLRMRNNVVVVVNVVGVVPWNGDKGKLRNNTCHESTGLGFVKQLLSLSLIHHH